MKHSSNPYQGYYSTSYKTKRAVDNNNASVKIIRNLLRRIPYASNNKILDVACGVSTLGKSFGDNVYGLDLNIESAKHAAKHGIKFKLGNVENKWDFPNDYFDIVIASHIIEHVVNPDFLLLESKRVLKKGGILIIGTPNLASWFNRILLLFGIQPFFTEVSTQDKTLGLKFTRAFTKSRNPLGHLRVFTYGALRDILELHTFKNIESYGMEFIPFPKLILFFDRIISRFVTLSSTMILVGKKL